MEVEKKEINETEEVKSPNEELLKAKRDNNKKSAIIVVLVFAIILLLALVLLYYFNNKDKDNGKNGGTPVATSTPPTKTDNKVLSNDEAIKIAKEKVEAANNFFGSFESSFECADSIEDGYCYFDTADNFKKKFYSIYSSELSYSNVYNDVTDSETYNFLFGAQIKIKDNKVYVWNHCTEGTNGYSLKGNYSLKNATQDTIVVKYLMSQEDEFTGDKNDIDEEVKLVKENNEWRIMKATIIGRCTSAEEVGK